MKTLFKFALAIMLFNLSVSYADDRCEGCGGGDNKAQEIVKNEKIA